MEFKLRHFSNKIITILIILATIFSNFDLIANRSDVLNKLPDNMTTEERIEHLRKEIKFYDTKDPKKVIRLSNDLLKISYSTQNSDLEYESLNYIAMAYVDLKETEVSNSYLFKALDLLKESEPDSIKSKLYNNIGSNYFFQDKFDSSAYYYEKALDINKRINNISEISILINNLAHLYNKLEQYEKAFEHNFYLLDIYEKQEDAEKTTDILIRIANSYIEISRFDDAVIFAEKAVNLVRLSNDTKKLARVLTTLGNVYLEKKEFKTAMTHYSEALSYVKDIKSSKGKAVLLNNIGLIQKQFGNYKEAFQKIEESIEIRKEIGAEDDLFHPYTSLAELSMKQGKFYDAIKFLHSAMAISVKNNERKEINDTYYLLYTSYKNLDKYDSALKYYESYTMLKDSLVDSELSSVVENLKIKYETEKKESENNLLRNQNTTQKIYFTVILGLIFAFLILLYAKYRSKQETNRKLNEKNEQIKKQHDELQQMYSQLQLSEEQLREANATKDKFFSIIAHDLKNPIHAITLSSDLLINKFKYMDAEQLVEVVQNINKSGNHLSVLLTNLLEWSRAKTYSIDFQPEIIDLRNASRDTMGLLEMNAKKKDISLVNNITDSTFIYADPNMIDTILRNLVSNAIKFTPQNGFVSISANVENESVVIKVKDNGIGMSSEDQHKLFRLDVHHTTKGTYNEKGTGLGLLLCKEFVEKHEGTIEVKSEIGEGSTFIIRIPLNKTNLPLNKSITIAKTSK